MHDLLVWAMTTGEAGMQSQALGLAEALGGTIVQKTIRLRLPWSLLRGDICPAPFAGLDPAYDIPAPPWPDVLITCGRRSAAMSIAIRKAAAGRTATVHVQDPRCPVGCFDLVVAMAHDGVVGDNVVIVDAALNRITPEHLAAGRDRWTAAFAALPRPLLGVFLGGRTRNQTFSDSDARTLVEALRRTHAETGAGIVVSPSRRTERSALAIISGGLAGSAWAYVWDGASDNPYFGMLALADGFVVTSDSISMISEALATGKPVATFALTGESRPQSRFLGLLRQRGYALPFDGTFPRDTGVSAINTTQFAAEKVKALLASRRSEAA